MSKNGQKQSFELFPNGKRIFKSSALKEIKGNKISYDKRLNNGNENFLVVSKYMPVSRVVEAIEKKTFFFCSPEAWLDPFEMLFYDQVKLESEKTIHACCFACNDIENEEGFWNIWSIDMPEPILRVTYNIKKLLNALECQSDNSSFYLAGMEYKPRACLFDIKDSLTDKSYSVEEYLNFLCLKREAYKYENELRLFVVREITNSSNTIIPDIDYSTGIIAEITLPPAKPLGNSHPARTLLKCMQDVQNLHVKNKLEELIKSNLLKCKMTQSALYCLEEKERVY